MRRDSGTPFLSFQRFLSGELVALFSCVGIRQKENNNDANGRVRDCLEESETPSASATLGAGHEGFSNGSLFGSAIDFYPGGIVLGHHIQPGNGSGWPSRLVRAEGAQKTIVHAGG